MWPNSPGVPPLLTPDSHFDPPISHLERMRGSAYPTCTINYDQCFGHVPGAHGPARASEIFVRIAFQTTTCGDCSACPLYLPGCICCLPVSCAHHYLIPCLHLVIRALVASSGRLGLSAFLPSPDRILPPAVPGSPSPLPPPPGLPHLPLDSDFQNAHFALRSVMGPWADASVSTAGGVNVRKWTMQMMQRYRFVVGELFPSASFGIASFTYMWTCAHGSQAKHRTTLAW